jgi:hypothetical protein
VAETELMPRLVGGDAERCCGKLKKGKGFLEPNFEVGPNWAGCRRASVAIYYYRRPVGYGRLWKEGVLMLPILIPKVRAATNTRLEWLVVGAQLVLNTRSL